MSKSNHKTENYLPDAKLVAGINPQNFKTLNINLNLKPMRNFRIFIVLSFLFASFYANSQTTGRDSVCVNSTNVKYYITQTAGATIQWSITGGGVIVGSSTNDTVFINWGGTPGVDTVKVVETLSGCAGDVVKVAVERFGGLIVSAGSDVTVGACATTTTLDGTATGAGVLTYSWTSNPAGFTSTLEDPSVTPAANTTYTLQVTSSTGCTNSDQVSVTIQALPVANAGTDATVCHGSTATLSGSVTTTGTITGYSWTSAPAGFTSSSASFTTGSGLTVATTFTLVVTDNKGCTGTDDVTISVQALPTADAGVTPANICQGETYDLDGTATNYSSILWSAGSGSFSTSATIEDPTYTPTTTGSIIITMQVTGTGACSAQTATDTMTLNVNPKPATGAIHHF